ncbi:MAG: TetR/AcrR family transcriptional regulator [bacterium]|nr:TetR/AcrR family transcriptional regulator [bacterium]
MKLSEQKIVDKKLEILEAAQACFVRKGFHNTTMQDICQQAGMSAGNIYRYFDSKEVIIEAFAADELQWMSTAINDVPSSPDMLQAIVDTVYWTATTLMENDKSELIAELFAEAGRNPRINAIYTKFNKQLTQQACGMLQELEDNDLLRCQHDKQLITRILISLVDGLVVNEIVCPDFDMTNMRPVIETMVTSLFVPIDPKVN